MEETGVPILFLVMEFAPINTTGNFRSLKFAKYLNQFGVKPIVVTFKEDEGAGYFKTKRDDALMQEVPEGTPIYRIHCDDDRALYGTRFKSFLTIYFSIKDTFARRWKRHLFKELAEIVAQHKPQLILTTLPPFSSGMLAVEIADRYKLPLVVDMRDLYSMWGTTPYGSWIHYWLAKAEERKIFSRANAILGVTPQLLKTFTTSHPAIDKTKFHLIPNGYDLPEALSSTFIFPPGKKKIVIGYVGSFYYYPEARAQLFTPWWKKRGHKILNYSPQKEDWLYRSPYFFFKTLAALFKNYPEFRDIVSIEFIGNVPGWLQEMINDFDLQPYVTLHGFVSYREVQLLQRNFDLLLATSEKVLDGEHYSLPSKIFDFIGLDKPIIGFVTDGIQKDFIKKSGLGINFSPDEVEESAEKLRKLFSDGQTFQLDTRYIESFHRKNLTERLAEIIINTALTVNSGT